MDFDWIGNPCLTDYRWEHHAKKKQRRHSFVPGEAQMASTSGRSGLGIHLFGVDSTR